MEHTKLSSHKFKKGVFVSPLNEFINSSDKNKSWMYGRLPEYLWIALILNKYGRKEGFKRLFSILQLVKEKTSLDSVRMSDFLLADVAVKETIFSTILDCVDADCLTPLTVVISVNIDSLFALKFQSKMSIQDRVNILQTCLKRFSWHQSDDATDIRYVVLVFLIMKGRLHLRESDFTFMYDYQIISHTDRKMELIRPFIRSCELAIFSLDTTKNDYLNLFWNEVSRLTECELFIMNNQNEKKLDTKMYYEIVRSVFDYLQQLYIDCNPLDKKMLVVLGIATYSFKRLEEAELHNLYCSISGRSIIRILIENYIMLRYLNEQESSNKSIWSDFEYYGIGQYKMVLTRHRESELKRESHVDIGILEAIVNEFTNEEFQNMDTRYFDRSNIREKSKKINESELYGLYYDYDSAFEHGLWGAIRETSLLKCNNPAHLYHCVPRVDDEPILKSVFSDCVYIMNKTIRFLATLYGVPEKMIGEIDKYEQSLIRETN